MTTNPAETGRICATLDGITMLPAGHVATVKTYLACRRRPLVRAALPTDVTLHRLAAADTARYRQIFAALGQRWLWWSRLMLPPAALADILGAPSIEAYVVVRAGEDVGLLEWDFSDRAEPELAFLGLTDLATGNGLGSALLTHILERMFADPITCVRVNTCTFDHPAALSFYRKNGFEPVRQAVEIVPDPRIAGWLPMDAAPHVPIISAAGDPAGA